MRYCKLLFILLAVISLSGCTTTLQKEHAAIVKSVYAARDASKIGRYDLSAKYLENATKLAPRPKDAIKVTAFTAPVWNTDAMGKSVKTDKVFSVLPDDAAIRSVIINGSPEYQKILNENAELKKKEEINNKNLAVLEKKTEEIQRAKEKEVQKQESKSWFSSLNKWFWGLGIVGILGLVAVIIFAPAFLPLILSVFGRLFGAFVYAINWVVAGVGKLIKK